LSPDTSLAGEPEKAKGTVATPERDGVVLVHGLWMAGWVMSPLGRRLRHCGFDPYLFSYPSMRSTLSQNASLLSRFAASIASPRIHFLGHSLGGLLILQMLEEYPEARTGRVILAGSPYNGSLAAQKISATALGRRFLGPSMLQWMEQKLPGAGTACQLGIIAGQRSLGGGRLISRLPKPNDGVVTVEETRVPDIADQIVLDVNHSGMLFSAGLARQACSFLRTGRFLHGPGRS
jgi:pimeloyl-ACP methyl ester carboxylesterase